MEREGYFVYAESFTANGISPKWYFPAELHRSKHFVQSVVKVHEDLMRISNEEKDFLVINP